MSDDVGEPISVVDTVRVRSVVCDRDVVSVAVPSMSVGVGDGVVGWEPDSVASVEAVRLFVAVRERLCVSVVRIETVSDSFTDCEFLLELVSVNSSSD